MRRPVQARGSYSDAQWWERSKRNRHEIIVGVVKEIQEQSAYRRARNLHHLRLYSDRVLTTATSGMSSRVVDDRGFRRPRLSLNVVRNCIDSATSMITRGRPAVQYITTEGDFTLQQRAKARSKFVQAIFHQNQAYDIGQRVFKDAAILDIGLAKICREYGRVKIEKTFPGEIWVNEEEATYGDPPSLFQVRAVDRTRLKALYSGKDKAIDDGEHPEGAGYRSRSNMADQVQVIEAWHLPSSEDSGDGRHCICTSAGMLRDEAYKHKAFPFAEMRWNDEPLGWHGCGLAYELTGVQYEINSLLRMAQMGMYSAGGMKILVERGAKIAKAHINNDLWATLLEYTGTKPDFITPEGISPALRMMLEFYVDQAYAITGITQLGARGEIPGGLAGSGRAQLVYKDIESQRFITVQRRYEQFFTDLADRCLEAAADLYEESGEFEATYIGKSFLQRISYADIGEDNDEFAVQSDNTSMLPQTIAGKYALAQNWEQAGYIDKNSARKLAGVPDTDAELSLALAPIDLIDRDIEAILEKGEAIWPDPRGDTALAKQRATMAFNRARINKVPGDRLDLLSEYIDAADSMLQIAEDENKAAAAQAMSVASAAGATGQTGLQAGAPPTIAPMEAA